MQSFKFEKQLNNSETEDEVTILCFKFTKRNLFVLTEKDVPTIVKRFTINIAHLSK